MTGFYLPYSAFLQGIAGFGEGVLVEADREFLIVSSLTGRQVQGATIKGDIICKGEA